MSALTDQLKETNKLLSSLHGTKQRKKKSASHAKHLSRVDGQSKKSGTVRQLPILLTRTVVITLLLVCVVIVIGGIEYFSDKEANALITSDDSLTKKNQEVVEKKLDDKQLLNILSER